MRATTLLPSGELYDPPADQSQSSHSYVYVGRVKSCGEMRDSVQKWGVRKAKRTGELQHLQSVHACAYRDYNVISGVGV